MAKGKGNGKPAAEPEKPKDTCECSTESMKLLSTSPTNDGKYLHYCETHKKINKRDRP